MQPKLAIRQAFARAAAHYDDFAQLQYAIAQTLLSELGVSQLSGKVLDVGCGTGFLTEQLSLQECKLLVALDIALPMLQRCRQRLPQVYPITAEAEALPLQSNSVKHIFSSLALQWSPNLPQAFGEFARVLLPDGQLGFATFGPQTLQELKLAWSMVDNYRHVNDFYSAAQLQALLADDWRILQCSTQVYVLSYPSVMALLHELKGLGAHRVNQGRKSKLTTPAQLQAMLRAYPVTEERVLASFEIIRVLARVIK